LLCLQQVCDGGPGCPITMPLTLDQGGDVMCSRADDVRMGSDQVLPLDAAKNVDRFVRPKTRQS
jgi:hypothetical protein